MARLTLGWLVACAALACARAPDPASTTSHPAPRASTPAAPPPPTSSSSNTASVPPAGSGETPPAPQPLAGGGVRAVAGELGIVTSAEEHATRAGVGVLEAGGNAVDAAVATALALAVTHPSAGNLGGGGFVLVRPKAGPTTAIDFRETAPGSLTRPDFDRMIAVKGRHPAAIGVPGTVAGLLLLQRRFGKLPRERVFAPAVRLARDGHLLGGHPAAIIARNWRTLSADSAARAIFGAARGAKPLPAGARLVQRDLAGTLERVAALGEAGFYEGEVARAIGAASGGRIGAGDLSSYRALEREPLRLPYRGFELETMPPPSAGGPALAGMLAALEQLDPGGSAAEDARDLHRFVEVARRAQAYRRFAVADPDARPAAERAAVLRRFLEPERLLEVGIDPERATPSASVHPLFREVAEPEHTTHLSAVDADGMVVALTTTLSASFGAGIVAPGTGVVLGNAVASFSAVGDNLPAPGRRTTSSMAPTLVLERGAARLVLGTPGGDTIPSTLALLVRRLVIRRLPLDLATDAPRLHHAFSPDEVRYEAARPLAPELLAGLRKLGHRVRPGRGSQGDANCLVLEGARAFGYADPREAGGLALAARTRVTSVSPDR